MLPSFGMVFTRSVPVATPVDRCVCHNKTFAELASLAKAENLDLAGLSARTGCSTNCGTCAPYIRLMLKGGWTRFPVLSQADFVRLLGPDGAVALVPCNNLVGVQRSFRNSCQASR